MSKPFFGKCRVCLGYSTSCWGKIQLILHCDTSFASASRQGTNLFKNFSTSLLICNLCLIYKFVVKPFFTCLLGESKILELEKYWKFWRLDPCFPGDSFLLALNQFHATGLFLYPKKTSENSCLHRSGVFIVNFEHVSHLTVVFVLITLSR